MGVRQVRIGVAAVEVGARDAVLRGSLEPQLRLEDGFAVRSSDTVKSVEEDLEVWVRAEEALDDIKVKDVLEHRNIVGSAVNDLDLEGAIGLGANGGDINVGNGCNLVRRERLGSLVDFVGDGLGGGATISQVVLDAKIILRALKMCKLVSFFFSFFLFFFNIYIYSFLLRSYGTRLIWTYHLGCDWQ